MSSSPKGRINYQEFIMKKTLALILALASIFACVFVLASCGVLLAAGTVVAVLTRRKKEM